MQPPTNKKVKSSKYVCVCVCMSVSVCECECVCAQVHAHVIADDLMSNKAMGKDIKL